MTHRGPDVFVPRLGELSAQSGVAVVFISPLPKLSVNACARWLSPNKAVIQLSRVAYTDDEIWFIFLQAAGHLLQNGKREIFWRGSGYMLDEDKQRSISRFVENEVIPSKELAHFMARGDFTKDAILSFANEVRMAPGVVVGYLQFRGMISKTLFNELKKKYFPSFVARECAQSSVSKKSSLEAEASCG
jgi:hypothetical protein